VTRAVRLGLYGGSSPGTSLSVGALKGYPWLFPLSTTMIKTLAFDVRKTDKCAGYM